MLSLCNYLYLSFAIALVQAGSLTFHVDSPSSVANRALGSSYDLGAVTSAGNAEQIGYFSGGSAAEFGIDSGIVLSTGSLTDSNDSEPSSDSETANADADIPDSQDSASISTTIKAKDGSAHATTTFGAVFCTCEDVEDANFQERAQILINGKLIYNRSKGPKDIRSTAQFGFASGDKASFSEGQCKCSDVQLFDLPHSQVADSIKVVVSDTMDGMYNSWIFLGIIGHADQALATATHTQTISIHAKATATSTISTKVEVQSITQRSTITHTATRAPSTVTVTAATSTSTKVNSACTDYVVPFEASCCPRSLLRKVASSNKKRSLKARQLASTTATSFIATTIVSYTAQETTTLQVVHTTVSTSTHIITETVTTTLAAPTATMTVTPITTKLVCKQIVVPQYKCPKNKTAKALLALQKTFLNSYAKKPKSTWRILDVRCDQDAQAYAYP